MKILRSLLSIVVTGVVACGGGDSGTNPPQQPPPAAQTLASVRLTTSSFSLIAGQAATLTPQALDATGAVIAGVTGYTFSSSDGTVAEARGDGSVLALGAGSAVVTVSLTRDGVTATTPANFTVTGVLPSTATVVASGSSNVFDPASIVVAVAAEVTFRFQAIIHNVTYGTTGAPNNIPNTSNADVKQTFGTAGDYPYDCTIHAGMRGTVIVR